MIFFLRGVGIYRTNRKGSADEAAQLFDKAIALDPQFARAIAWLGYTHLRKVKTLKSKDTEQSLKKAEDLARRAIAIDANSPFAYITLSRAHVFKRQYDQAIAEGQRAIEIEPNNAINNAIFARTSVFTGRLKEASALIKKALLLAPYPPTPFLGIAALIDYRLGRYQESLEFCRIVMARAEKSRTSKFCHLRIIAIYMALGRAAEARTEARTFLEQYPTFTLTQRAKVWKGRPDKDPSWIGPYIKILRKAGIPD